MEVLVVLGVVELDDGLVLDEGVGGADAEYGVVDEIAKADLLDEDVGVNDNVDFGRECWLDGVHE